MFCNVIVENKSNYIDTPYTYGAGELKPAVGSKVTVPFGTKEKTGYVFSLTDETEVEGEKIRDITSVDEAASLNEEMIQTSIWMKARYAIRHYDAVSLFTPPLGPRKRGTPKDPYKDLEALYVKPESLTEEQKAAVNSIKKGLKKDEATI